MRAERCEENEIAAAGEERKTLGCVRERGGRVSRQRQTYFTSCLSLQRPSECKMQSAAPGWPPAITLSASPHLARGEVDHERVKEAQTVGPESWTLQPPSALQVSLSSTSCPYLCLQCDGGKATLEQVLVDSGGRRVWAHQTAHAKCCGLVFCTAIDHSSGLLGQGAGYTAARTGVMKWV